MFAADEPSVWEEWLLAAIADWRERWLPFLERVQSGNEVAGKCAEALRKLGKCPPQDTTPASAGDERLGSPASLPAIRADKEHAGRDAGAPRARFWRAQAAAALEAISLTCKECPHGKKKAWLDPLKDFLGEADFLGSLARTGAGVSAAAADVSAAKQGKRTEGETPEQTGGTPAPQAPSAGADPLAEDWGWVRSQMTTLLELAR